MTDLLETMRHGHACPIANEHYAWAVAEIDRLRARERGFPILVTPERLAEQIAADPDIDC